MEANLFYTILSILLKLLAEMPQINFKYILLHWSASPNEPRVGDPTAFDRVYVDLIFKM